VPADPPARARLAVVVLVVALSTVVTSVALAVPGGGPDDPGDLVIATPAPIGSGHPDVDVLRAVQELDRAHVRVAGGQVGRVDPAVALRPYQDQLVTALERLAARQRLGMVPAPYPELPADAAMYQVIADRSRELDEGSGSAILETSREAVERVLDAQLDSARRRLAREVEAGTLRPPFSGTAAEPALRSAARRLRLYERTAEQTAGPEDGRDPVRLRIEVAAVQLLMARRRYLDEHPGGNPRRIEAAGRRQGDEMYERVMGGTSGADGDRPGNDPLGGVGYDRDLRNPAAEDQMLNHLLRVVAGVDPTRVPEGGMRCMFCTAKAIDSIEAGEGQRVLERPVTVDDLNAVLDTEGIPRDESYEFLLVRTGSAVNGRAEGAAELARQLRAYPPNSYGYVMAFSDDANPGSHAITFATTDDGSVLLIDPANGGHWVRGAEIGEWEHFVYGVVGRGTLPPAPAGLIVPPPPPARRIPVAGAAPPAAAMRPAPRAEPDPVPEDASGTSLRRAGRRQPVRRGHPVPAQPVGATLGEPPAASELEVPASAAPLTPAELSAPAAPSLPADLAASAVAEPVVIGQLPVGQQDGATQPGVTDWLDEQARQPGQQEVPDSTLVKLGFLAGPSVPAPAEAAPPVQLQTVSSGPAVSLDPCLMPGAGC
jgi:hypothetical protein